MLAAAAAVFILAACGKKEQPAPPPPTVTVATPVQQNIVDWDEYVGRFEAIKDVEVKPRVSGYLTSANFRDDIDLSGVVDKPDIDSVNANKGHRIR